MKHANKVLGMVAVTLVTLLLAMYVAGYLMLSKVTYSEPASLPGDVKWRAYAEDWQVNLFGPATAIEAWLLGRKVAVVFAPREEYKEFWETP